MGVCNRQPSEFLLLDCLGAVIPGSSNSWLGVEGRDWACGNFAGMKESSCAGERGRFVGDGRSGRDADEPLNDRPNGIDELLFIVFSLSFSS